MKIPYGPPINIPMVRSKEEAHPGYGAMFISATRPQIRLCELGLMELGLKHRCQQFDLLVSGLPFPLSSVIYIGWINFGRDHLWRWKWKINNSARSEYQSHTSATSKTLSKLFPYVAQRQFIPLYVNITNITYAKK